MTEIDLSAVDRIKLLKAHAVRFSREEVMAVLDLVGSEYFRRQLAFTSEEAVQTMVEELAGALAALPPEVKGPVRELIRSL